MAVSVFLVSNSEGRRACRARQRRLRLERLEERRALAPVVGGGGGDDTGGAVPLQEAATALLGQSAEVPNLIGTKPPTSQTYALPTKVNPQFVVGWTGSDDPGGSGVASYDVYVSIDDSPFQLWQSAVSHDISDLQWPAGA